MGCVFPYGRVIAAFVFHVKGISSGNGIEGYLYIDSSVGGRTGESFVKLEIEVPIQNRVRGYLDSGGREDSVPFHSIYPYPLEFPLLLAKHSPSPLCMGVSPAIVNVFLSDCLTFPTYSPKDFGVSGEAIGSGVLPSKK